MAVRYARHRALSNYGGDRVLLQVTGAGRRL